MDRYLYDPFYAHLHMYAVKDNSVHLSATEPTPAPWRDAVASLISLVATKEAAGAMTNKGAAQRVIAAADSVIAQIEDEYCGTRVPHSGPPPSPWWCSLIAAELTVVANTLQQGNLRNNLSQLSSHLLDRLAANSPVP